uniref:Pre-mRNA-processing factor 17-like n=1 Tax=Sinocyclocheilus anshuiensis TaxID=1608454 RepID=A0A671N289_9TELE
KMAAAASSLVSYGSGSDSENESEFGNVTSPQKVDPDAVAHLQPLKPGTITALAVLNSAPEVAVKEDVETGVHLDPALKEVTYNPTYETMFAPEFGPTNPFRSKQMSAPRNMLSGYAEPAHVNDFMFEQQRRTFSTFGYALDPSVDTSEVSSSSYIGAVEEAEKNKGLMVFETGAKKTEKRKKVKGGDASDIESFLGPWAKYQDEKDVAKPSEDEQKELDEILAKRQKRGKNEEEAPAEEKTVLHVKEAYDYQGRSYLHVPQDVGINLRSADVPEKCYLPKKQLHVWTGHTKGVSAIRLFPVSAHLLLSCSMDCKIKLWEVYNDRRCVRTFIGESCVVSISASGRIKHLSDVDIPVDFKYIAEPSMHSMPAVTLSPNGKWLACQSMDNQILIFGAQNRFRLNKKKIFKGHMVAGYACQVDFSPDMSYVVSGDADGKLNIWDWKTTKLYHRIKAHDKVCISALWHPHETSKVITCGWDGQIKLWD